MNPRLETPSHGVHTEVPDESVLVLYAETDFHFAHLRVSPTNRQHCTAQTRRIPEEEAGHSYCMKKAGTRPVNPSQQGSHQPGVHPGLS